MEIVECNALLNRLCPRDWLRTHAETIGKKIHNNLKDLLSQKWRDLTNNPHNHLFVVIENNYRTKLQNKTTAK
jgi:hypothetical protein